MNLIIDPNIQAVAEYMQNTLSTNCLVAVSQGLAKLAPLLWGHYETEDVSVLRVEHRPISDRPLNTQATSSE